MTKTLGFLIVAAAGFIAGLALKDDLIIPEKPIEAHRQQTPAEQTVLMIDRDFHQLGIDKQLPEAWLGIKTVEYKMGSFLAKSLLGDLRPHFPQNKEGNGHLEVEVLDLPDETNPGFILQVSLFDLKSKNKIFEVGRSYTMNDLNKPSVKTEKKTEAAEKPTQSAQ
jgi:hypothetical protein